VEGLHVTICGRFLELLKKTLGCISSSRISMFVLLFMSARVPSLISAVFV
jgi:hypothetical protein